MSRAGRGHRLARLAAVTGEALWRLIDGTTREDRRLRAAILLSVAYVSGWAVLHMS